MALEVIYHECLKWQHTLFAGKLSTTTSTNDVIYTSYPKYFNETQ